MEDFNFNQVNDKVPFTKTYEVKKQSFEVLSLVYSN